MIPSVGTPAGGVRQTPSSLPTAPGVANGRAGNVVPLPTPARRPRVEPRTRIRSEHDIEPSLAARMVNAIRPKLDNPVATRPAGIRASLKRINQALGSLRADLGEPDPFLETASLVLAEECLRVEILRQRMQMALKD
jgi:hypothetical protein